MASGIRAFFSCASQGASPARRITRAAAKASSDEGPRMPSVAANRPASPASRQPNRLKTMTLGPGRGLGDGESFGELGAGEPMQLPDDLPLRFGERRRGAADRQQGNAGETQENRVSRSSFIAAPARRRSSSERERRGSAAAAGAAPSRRKPRRRPARPRGSNGIFTRHFYRRADGQPGGGGGGPVKRRPHVRKRRRTSQKSSRAR